MNCLFLIKYSVIIYFLLNLWKIYKLFLIFSKKRKVKLFSSNEDSESNSEEEFIKFGKKKLKGKGGKKKAGIGKVRKRRRIKVFSSLDDEEVSKDEDDEVSLLRII